MGLCVCLRSTQVDSTLAFKLGGNVGKKDGQLEGARQKRNKQEKLTS